MPWYTFPWLFHKSGFWKAYPYFLPNAVAFVVNVAGFAMAYFWLRETKVNAGMKYERFTDEELELEVVKEERSEPKQTAAIEVDQGESPFGTGAADEIATLPQEGEGHSSQCLSSLEVNGAPVVQDSQPRESFSRGLRAVLTDKLVVLAMCSYAIVGFVFLAYDEVFNFWSIRDVKHGGVQFTQVTIGIIQMALGMAVMLFQLLCFPLLERRIGLLLIHRVATVCWAVAIFLVPFMNVLVPYAVLFWPCMLLLASGKTIFGVLCFSSINIMTNNGKLTRSNKCLLTAAASDDGNIGLVNGLATSVAALSRLFAPVVGGVVFAYSSNSHLPFPFNYHLIFNLLSVLALGNFILISSFPRSINSRRRTKLALQNKS